MNYTPTFPSMNHLAVTYAAWPVWSGSTTKEVKFQPIPKKLAYKIWDHALDYDQRTDKKGKHAGAIGRPGLLVLHAMLFKFLRFNTGALFPSIAAIARAARCCPRTVATALKTLKAAGIITWIRRCSEKRQPEGGFVLKQDTNAYHIHPPTAWRGYRAPSQTPIAPEAGTWGDHPGLPSVRHQAVTQAEGGTMRQMIATLDSDPSDALAAALARLGAGLLGRSN
jgi:hypothetical protein